VIELEDAMQSLAVVDARAARVAELRIFGGMSMDHVARLLSTSVPTAERDWRFARVFLERQYGRTSESTKLTSVIATDVQTDRGAL
jgi:hypothetical protein